MSDIPAGTVREHYRESRDVYEQLAKLAGNETILPVNDFRGWYVKRDNDDVDELEKGWTKKATPTTIAEFDTVLDRTERTFYAITSYKKPGSLERERACRYTDDGTEWKGGEKPTPEWSDMVAQPAWGDVDLADDLKEERGELDDDTRRTIERTLEAYIDEYAKLYGDRGAIQALDSVGGAYIFGPPEATLPIARAFKDDADAHARVFEELTDRMNDYLREAEGRVNSRVPGASDVIHPDWVNNRNRQYKAPLSLHSSHNAVVTPLDTDRVEYELTPFADVDDDLRTDAIDWAKELTATEHMECAETLVETLWPEYTSAASTWKDALEEWVKDEREREKEEEKRRQQAEKERTERLDGLGVSATGQSVTPHMTDVYAALETVDTAEIVRQHASDAWDTGDHTEKGKVEFDPSWRTSSSGSSCFVDKTANRFGDAGQGGGGYAAKAMALGKRIITDASKDLEGEKWSKAVDELRNAGENIPVWIPQKGTEHSDGGEYDLTPYWAVVKAAVVLGVVDRDDLEERERDGDTYLAIPDNESFNDTLDALEENGIDHGLEYRVTDDRVNNGSVTWDQIKGLYSDPETDNKFARHAAVAKLLNENDYATPRDTAEIYSYYPPDGVFELGGERDIDQTISRKLGPHYSQHELREILGQVRARTYVDRDDFDAGQYDDDLVCLGNCVYDFNTGGRLDHSPEYLFTHSIPWDLPESVDDAECPAIEGFMDEITQREADKLTMYEFIGHALLPHYDYKALMVLFGPGDNGKSVFYNVVMELLGGMSNISAAEMADLAENRFRAETVIGNYANIGPDMDARKVSDMGMIKKMTGGDPIQVEPKGKEAYEVSNTATMMFGCNEPPVLPERGRKIATRLYPIELPYEFKSNPDSENPLEKKARPRGELLEEITTESEMEGLLAKAIAGAQRLIERNGEFSLPESPEERMELYEQHSDPIKQFAVKCLDNEQGETVSKDDVYNLYVEFCRENDNKNTSRNVFFEKLRQTTFSYSETRPRGDGKRKTLLANATFTDHAYTYDDGILFDDTDETSTAIDAPEGVTPVADLETGEMATVTAELAQLYTNKKAWYAEEGWLVDSTGAVKLILRDDIADDLEEEKAYRIDNASVHPDDDGVLSVEPIPGMTTVTEIDKGDGLTQEDGAEWLSYDETEHTSDDVDETTEAVTDGGDETGENAARDDPDSDATEHTPDTADAATEDDGDDDTLEGEPLGSHIYLYVKENQKARDGVPRDELKEHLLERGAAETTIETWIGKCLEEGRIGEPADEVYTA